MILSVMRGWPASGARARLGSWFMSTPGQSAVHGNATHDPHRAGAPLPGLRFLRAEGWGWVAEIGGCSAECAHPAEKSASGS
jgi:hypothetical protein